MQNWLLENQIIIVGIVIWSLPWKAVALWKAARNNNLIWFIVLLLVNSLGVVDILYIFLFANGAYKKTIERFKQLKIKTVKAKTKPATLKAHAKKKRKKKT